MKKQHQIKKTEMWKFPKSDFLSDAFLFRKRRVKVWVCTGNRMAVATTGDRRRCNITRICAESLMKNQS